MSSFNALIGRPDIGMRFYAEVQGIWHRFYDGAIPLGPTGAAWAAGTSKGFAWSQHAHMLDVSEGVEDIGPWISRASSETQPGGMTLTLKDDRGGTLVELLATESSEGNTANLTASFGYGTGGGPTTMAVDSTAGWASAGAVFFGNETIQYSGKTATTFTGLTRDTFSVGYGDQAYAHNADIADGTSRVVSDYVRDWAGRYIRLYAYMVAADGTSLDAGTGGVYTREIWRGTINAIKPRRDWHRFDIDADSIDAILNTEVGFDPVPAALLRLPGDAEANQSGKFDMWGGPGTWPLFITDDTRFIDFTVARMTVSSGNTIKIQGPDTYSVAVTDGYDVMGREQLRMLIQQRLQDQMTAGGYLGWWSNHFDDDGSMVFEFNPEEVGTEWTQATIHWGAPGSVGKLLGFSGSSSFGQGGASQKIEATEEELSVYISADATRIPFYYLETLNQAASAAPSSGYARLGDEIIAYTGVQAFTASSPVYGTLHGLYELTGVTRGHMGTRAAAHSIGRGDIKVAVESMTELTFGVGWDGDSFVDAILQLVVSTGEAAHHTAHDLLPARMSVPLNPNHFDVAAIEAIRDGLTQDQAGIHLFASEPFNLGERIASWLRPHGLFILPRQTADGEYRIGIGRVIPPLESEAGTTINTSHLDHADPAVHVLGNSTIINTVIIRPRWDAANERNTEDTVTVQQGGPRHTRQSVTWDMVGYNWAVGDVYARAASWARQLFARYGRSYSLLQLNTNRDGLLIEPADTVSITVPGIPNQQGSRGYVGRLAQVLRVRRLWHSGTDSGEVTGAEVTVIIENYARHSTYSPSARVSSYAAGTPSVTLKAQEYTNEGADVDHFDVGDEVVIMTEGDWSTADVLTIDGITGNVVTLSGTLTNATPVDAAETVMVPAAYTAVQESQERHAFIGSNALPSLVGSDNAFRYI